MNFFKLVLFIIMVIALLFIISTVSDTLLQILLLISGILFIAIFFILTEDMKEALTDD